MSETLIASAGTYFGNPIVIICDAQCDKAWGWNNRPCEHLSDDEDNVVWLADGELGIAPIDPGTYEGDHAKPTTPEERHNKWCARECERRSVVSYNKEFELKDWSKRIYNIPQKDMP